MSFIRFLSITLLVPGIAVPAASAQETDAETDPAITILDQVVEVADEAAESGPPSDETEAAVAPEPSEVDERAELRALFARYKDLKDGGVYDEAENVAKQVIEASIRLSGPTSNDTALALNNLAIVQHATRNYEAAQQNFEAAIEIIEDNEDRLNKMLINPLRGLAAAQLESGRPDLAARTYGRAVHISHVNEGPHNLEQIQLLEGLAETHLRLGDLEEARNSHDMIYALNLRYYNGNAMEIVPSLLRRAQWQRRTGYILDERATYRRILRIIETTNGKDDLLLVEPLLKLGESYFFVDVSESMNFQATTIASGEMYFKRAVRIAEDNPESSWHLIAETKLALGDYYNFRTDIGRARKNYKDVWGLLSQNDDRLDLRRTSLEKPVVLNGEALPVYVGGATVNDRQLADPNIREGRIVASYDVNSRGRVQSLKIVEAEPAEFADMQRMVQRELRTRIYRPRYEEANAQVTPDQVFTHTFYYRQEELEELQAEAVGRDER